MPKAKEAINVDKSELGKEVQIEKKFGLMLC